LFLQVTDGDNDDDKGEPDAKRQKKQLDCAPLSTPNHSERCLRAVACGQVVASVEVCER
jgi:hypothetical protein